MTAFVKILHRAASHPGRIPLMIRNRLGWLAYYGSNGSKAFLPREIVLYINNTCNARCVMCDIGLHRQESTFNRLLSQTNAPALSLETCLRLADELKRYPPTINIGGVEPLLREDIHDIVAVFKDREYPVKLVTNGWFLPDYAEKLMHAGLDHIVVSLDGSQSVHDKIRGDGFYERAVEGIQRLRRAERRLGKKITITLNYCINPCNYHLLLPFAQTMLDIEKVDAIRFANLFFIDEEASRRHNTLFGELGPVTSANIHQMDLSAIDIPVLWNEFQRVRQRFPHDRIQIFPNIRCEEDLRIYYQHPEVPLKNQRCLTPWQSATVISDGNVIIRNRCIEFVAGNIHRESFTAIWNGPRYAHFRRELKNAGLFPACNRCCGAF